MPDPAFARLIERVRARDPQAAVQFVRAYRPGLERYAATKLRRSGVGPALDADDVCQSVLLTFLGWLDRGGVPPDDPERVGRLLRRAARNRISDEVRRLCTVRRGGGAAASTNADDYLDSAPSNCGTPSANASRAEVVAILRERLSPEELDLVERRRSGEGWAEIAASVGGTPDAIRKKVSRAVDRVYRELNPSGRAPRPA